MDPLTLGLLIGGGGGLAKSFLVDQPRENSQRKQRAAEIRFSPWTKLQPSTQIQEADPLGGAMQGAMTGAMVGQGVQNQELTKNLVTAQTNALNRGQNITALSPAAPTTVSGSYFGTSPWFTR